MSRFGIRRRLKALVNGPSKGAPREDPRATYDVVFDCPDGTSYTAQAKDGDSLLLTSGRGEQPISSACMDGSCGTCRVVMVDGLESLTPADVYEKGTKANTGVPAEQRLGCQAGVIGPGVRVQIINVLGEELVDP